MCVRTCECVCENVLMKLKTVYKSYMPIKLFYKQENSIQDLCRKSFWVTVMNWTENVPHRLMHGRLGLQQVTLFWEGGEKFSGQGLTGGKGSPWVSFWSVSSLPSCYASSKADSDGDKGPETETSKTMKQKRSFCWNVSTGTCYSTEKSG